MDIMAKAKKAAKAAKKAVKKAVTKAAKTVKAPEREWSRVPGCSGLYWDQEAVKDGVLVHLLAKVPEKVDWELSGSASIGLWSLVSGKDELLAKDAEGRIFVRLRSAQGLEAGEYELHIASMDSGPLEVGLRSWS